MIEHERSYIFRIEGADWLLEKLSNNGVYVSENPAEIDDHYYQKGFRIRRKAQDKVTWTLTQKTGEKSRGFRTEDECDLSESAGRMLASNANMTVSKKRFQIDHANNIDWESYDVTIDFVESPMKLAILEIESTANYPIPDDITTRLFGIEFSPCPLDSYSLFNRKIGICGGPSSGKSETSKFLSHQINADFGGNSFHVAEFATTFIQKYNRTPQFMDQFLIWYGQREREENASKANVVISDCPTFLNYIYASILQNSEFSKETALFMSKMYKRVLFDTLAYTDLIFLKIQNYAENNIRYQSKDEAIDIENRIERFMQDHRIPYISTSYLEKANLFDKLFYVNRV